MIAAARAYPPPPDAGIATVWAAAGVAVLTVALLLGLHLGSAIMARHRAESAADLAALAAAGVAVEGPPTACDRAVAIAAAVGAQVASCRLSGWNALVEVHVAVAAPLAGSRSAVGRARAGPVDPADTDGMREGRESPPGRASSASRPAAKGRSARTGRTRTVPRRHRPFRAGRPTTRRRPDALVVAAQPVSDGHWRAGRRGRLLDSVHVGSGWPDHELAPRTAVGPVRPPDAPPEPVPPRLGRRRPARPRRGRPAAA